MMLNLCTGLQLTVKMLFDHYLDIGKFMFLSYGHNISYSTADINLQNMKEFSSLGTKHLTR